VLIADGFMGKGITGASLAIASAVVLLAPTNALADRASVSPRATRDKVGNPQKRDEIAEKESSDEDEETRPVEASADAEQLGRVTWAGARVDIPVFGKFSLLPQAELLHVFSSSSPGDEDMWNPYVGAGLGFHPREDWTFELSALFGPTSFNVGSIAGTLAVTKEFGADWSHDKPPGVELSAELAVTRYSFEDGTGPAGSDILQSYLSLEALLRVGSHVEITPKAMGFLYDKTLYAAQGSPAGVRLDGIPVLARVGTFAPRALVGVRLGYAFAKWLIPFVEIDEIVYAAGIGDASEITGGVRFQLGEYSSMTAGGGALANRVSGPLVAPGTDGTVPVALLGVELGF
jgi:hypothetical protein